MTIKEALIIEPNLYYDDFEAGYFLDDENGKQLAVHDRRIDVVAAQENNSNRQHGASRKKPAIGFAGFFSP